MTYRAFAPGKVMVAGEYVVLHGGRALVMAVSRGVYATSADAVCAMPRETVAALGLGRTHGWWADDAWVSLDVSAMESDGRKLGLGSSAAGCVAAMAATLVRHGHDVNTHRAELARLARKGHQAAQGGGSGVDVYASAFGGMLAVGLPDGPEGEVVAESVPWPSTLCWRVLWTGTPARTSDLLRSVHAFASRDPASMARHLDTLRTATDALESALRHGRAHEAVRAVSDHRFALDALGLASGTPIVTDAMRQLAAHAAPLGVAIKPSGAGGGDIVLAVAHDGAALDTLVDEARPWGFSAVDLSLDTLGVRRVEGG